MKASPCIFTRPMVGSSGRTEIDTYSAIMTVKCQLKSAGVTASSKFQERIFSEILWTEIYVTICKLIVSSIRKGYPQSKKQC